MNPSIHTYFHSIYMRACLRPFVRVHAHTHTYTYIYMYIPSHSTYVIRMPRQHSTGVALSNILGLPVFALSRFTAIFGADEQSKEVGEGL